jgi:hypothetical protein
MGVLLFALQIPLHKRKTGIFYGQLPRAALHCLALPSALLCFIITSADLGRQYKKRGLGRFKAYLFYISPLRYLYQANRRSFATAVYEGFDPDYNKGMDDET